MAGTSSAMTNPFAFFETPRRRGSLFLIPPFYGEGGAKRRVGLSPHTLAQPPTRHIVRAAPDVPSLPTSGRDKEESFARLDPTSGRDKEESFARLEP